MTFEFKEYLKYQLSKKTIRAKDLADAIGKVPSYITKMQKGEISPNHKDLRILANMFGVEYEFLLFQIGYIDAHTLTHIKAFTSLRSYLAEIMNLNSMTIDKYDVYDKFIKNNFERLDNELTDELIVEVINALGDDFVYPSYKNPYSEDCYPKFRKIPSAKFATSTSNITSSESQLLPVYNDFSRENAISPISNFPITLDTIRSKATDPDNEFFWYSPTKTISENLYLIEKSDVDNGDKILYKDNGTIFTGRYLVTQDLIIISNSFDTHNNKSIDAPPLTIPLESKTNIYIIGKVISTLRTA